KFKALPAEELAWLEEIDLKVSDDDITPDEIREGMTAAAAAGVAGLVLWDCDMHPKRMKARVEPVAAHLRELALCWAGGSAESRQALVETPGVTGLTCLEVNWTGLGLAGAKALAAWPGLANLTRLSLVNVDLNPAGVRALAASPHRLAAEDLSAGGQAPSGGRLRELILAENRDLGDRGIKLLATSWLPHSPLHLLPP